MSSAKKNQFIKNMTILERLQPFLVLISVILGLSLGQNTGISQTASVLIVPLLDLMLYATFIPLDFKKFKETRGKLNVVLISLGINFVWTPLFAWGLGAIFLNSVPDVWVGFLMLMVTPCTDWYLVFTGISGGNVALATALLPLNLILQILLLPLYLLIFANQLVSINPAQLLNSLLWVLLLPWLLAVLSRRWILWAKSRRYFEVNLSKISQIQVLALNGAIVAIFASEGRSLINRPDILLSLILPIGLFFVCNFSLGYFLGQRFKLSYEDFACLTCTTLARNSPLSLAVAASVFPHQPLITLTLVIGPLIELPTLVLVSQLLLKIQKQERWTV